MNARVISLVLSLGICAIVVELVRRDKLTFKYALGWLCLSLMAVFFAACERCLFSVAYFFGFALPSNFIFFVSFLAVVLLSLMLTIFLCQQNRRNDRLAQKIALLEDTLEEMKKGLAEH